MTCWPPYILTPRRCPLLSRPLRVLPCPFLCAIGGSSAISVTRTVVMRLPVPAAATVVLAALLLEDEDLAVATLGDDLAAHARRPRPAACRCGPASSAAASSTSANSTAAPTSPSRRSMRSEVAGCDAVLLASGANDGVGHDLEEGATGLPREAHGLYLRGRGVSTARSDDPAHPLRSGRLPPLPRDARRWSTRVRRRGAPARWSSRRWTSTADPALAARLRRRGAGARA